MKDAYFIVGNSGLAKEILFLALDCGYDLASFKGFVDKEPKEAKAQVMGHELPVLAQEEFLDEYGASEIAVFFAIGDPKILSKVTALFSQYAFKFPNLIHPSVSYHKESVSWGKGNLITAGCRLTCDIAFANFNLLNLNSTVGHDSEIGDCNIINPGVNISGGVKLYGNSLIGTGATILQNLVIGEGAIVGGSSLVTKNVAEQTVVVGIPAKPLIR